MWIWGEDKCRNGVSLHVSGVERVSSRAIDQRFKNYNRADLVQARLEAYDHGCDDAVLAGPDGFLTEGPGFNVFVVSDGTVASPGRQRARRDHAPRGARAVRARGDPVRAAPDPSRGDGRGERGVREHHRGRGDAGDGINGKPIGNGHAGLVTSRIQSAYWSGREAGWHGVRPGDILAG